MTVPAVSVVLPTYNRADTVGRSIRSVLGQTFTDLELIVVDDGSVDDTSVVLEGFDDPRMRVLRLPANRGVCAARNAGIEQARGALIAFQDSDDEWRPQKLERQVECLALAGDDVGVIGCGWQLHGVRQQRTTLPACRGRIYKEILTDRASGLGTPMLLVRRVPDAQPMFDESIPALEERDFKLQYASRFAVDAVDEVLVDVHRGRRDHVASPRNALLAYRRYIEKYAADLARWPDASAYYHWQAGREAVRCGERRAALGFFRGALAGGHADGRMWLDAGLGLALGDLGLRIASRLARRRAPR